MVEHAPVEKKSAGSDVDLWIRSINQCTICNKKLAFTLNKTINQSPILGSSDRRQIEGKDIVVDSDHCTCIGILWKIALLTMFSVPLTPQRSVNSAYLVQISALPTDRVDLCDDAVRVINYIALKHGLVVPSGNLQGSRKDIPCPRHVRLPKSQSRK